MESLTKDEFTAKWYSVMMADRRRKMRGLQSLPEYAEVMAESNRRANSQSTAGGPLSAKESLANPLRNGPLLVGELDELNRQFAASSVGTPAAAATWRSSMAKLPADASYLSVERREFYAKKLATLPAEMGVPVWLVNEIKAEVAPLLQPPVPEWQREALESQKRAAAARHEEAIYSKRQRILRGTW